jgi:hypothetical protein
MAGSLDSNGVHRVKPAPSSGRLWDLSIEFAAIYAFASLVGHLVWQQLQAGRLPSLVGDAWTGDAESFSDHGMDLAWLVEAIALPLAIRLRLSRKALAAIAFLLPFTVAAIFIRDAVFSWSFVNAREEVVNFALRDTVGDRLLRAAVGGLAVAVWTSYRTRPARGPLN